jgi:uncharacterized membrane protein
MVDKEVPEHVTDTVAKLARLHAAAEEGVTSRQRSVEAVADRLGRPLTTYAIACGVLGWVGLNVTLASLGSRPFDPPPFPLLQATATVAALLVTTVILTAQNRQQHVAEERTQLDLHVNLTAERKVAKLIALLEELRRDLPNVANRRDSVAEAMTEALDPNTMVTALREKIEAVTHDEILPEPSATDGEPTSRSR